MSIFLATFMSIQSSDIAPVFHDRGTENRHHCLLTWPLLSPSWSIILASLIGSCFGPIGSTVFLSYGLPITLCLNHIGGGHIWMCKVKYILSCWSNIVMPILLDLTRPYSSYGVWVSGSAGSWWASSMQSCAWRKQGLGESCWMNGQVLTLLHHLIITKTLWHVVVRLRMQNWKCFTNRIIATSMFYITSLLHSQREAALFLFNSNVPWKFTDDFRAQLKKKNIQLEPWR